LGSDLCISVNDLDIQFICSLDNGNSVFRADIVSDFGSIGSVVHEQELQFLQVADGDLLESRGQKMTVQLVASITNLWHWNLALEAATDTIINTLWFSPALLEITQYPVSS
jgi:hypothetical protein